MRTAPGGIRDRHHILYPHRIWRNLPAHIRDLRGGFAVKINKNLHGQLHQEVDKELGEEIDVSYLPGESVLNYVANNYFANEDAINELDAVAKIDWLLKNFTDKDPQNEWLRMMLSCQREFLVSHVEGQQ